MKTFLFVLAAMISTGALAGSADALMRELAWQKRVVLIFTPTAELPEYVHQNRLLKGAGPGLDERDIVILRIFSSGEVTKDAVPAGLDAEMFYQKYAQHRSSFSVLLVGKDTGVKLQQHAPLEVETLFGVIDAMPMRRYEMLGRDD